MSNILLILGLFFFTSCDSSAKISKDDDQQKETTDMNKQDKSILEAVKNGKVNQVAQALKNGADANSTDEQKRSLLLIATHNNDLAMAKLLVSHGADVNQQDNIQDSPFLYTGASGNLDLLKLYLANGARFDVFNRYRGSALIPACERGHVEIVRTLANTKGFPIDHINRLGWTGLLEAVILGDGSQKYVDIIQILIEAGSDINIADSKGVTPLAHAKNMGFTKIAKLLEGKR